METTFTATANGTRPPYFDSRRRLIADLMLDHGLGQAIDREMAAGSWAIIYDDRNGKLTQTLFDRGFGWISGIVGLWADTLIRTARGPTVTLDDRALLVPNISRDQAVGISHAVGHSSVLYGSAGRYTSIDTTVPLLGRDCAWEDVRPAFKPLSTWALRTTEADLQLKRWSFAPPASWVGRDRYEYLFDCRPSRASPRTPTHFFYLRLAEAKHREPWGLVPWTNGTPFDLLKLDAWLPLTAA